jgi:hypothetical protein
MRLGGPQKHSGCVEEKISQPGIESENPDRPAHRLLNANGSGSCAIAGFCINGVEPSVSVTRQLKPGIARRDGANHKTFHFKMDGFPGETRTKYLWSTCHMHYHWISPLGQDIWVTSHCIHCFLPRPPIRYMMSRADILFHGLMHNRIRPGITVFYSVIAHRDVQKWRVKDVLAVK